MKRKEKITCVGASGSTYTRNAIVEEGSDGKRYAEVTRGNGSFIGSNVTLYVFDANAQLWRLV